MVRTLGIIPARGGSKGVPKKNIRLCAGLPLIAWSIRAACDSCVLDQCCVSTDDEEIAEVAQRYGAEIIQRPAELSQDFSPMILAVEHALKEAEAGWGAFDYVCLMQPTSPQRTAEDIDQAMTLLMNPYGSYQPDSVISVYRVEDHHPARMYTIAPTGLLAPYDLAASHMYTDGLRQNLPAVYHRNGAIYGCTARLIKEEHELIGKVVVPYLMPRARSLNIDDLFDVKLADLYMRQEQAERLRIVH